MKSPRLARFFAPKLIIYMRGVLFYRPRRPSGPPCQSRSAACHVAAHRRHPTFHTTDFKHYFSPIFHTLRLTPYVLRLTFYVLRLTPHVLRFTFYATHLSSPLTHNLSNSCLTLSTNAPPPRLALLIFIRIYQNVSASGNTQYATRNTQQKDTRREHRD